MAREFESIRRTQIKGLIGDVFISSIFLYHFGLDRCKRCNVKLLQEKFAAWQGTCGRCPMTTRILGGGRAGSLLTFSGEVVDENVNVRHEFPESDAQNDRRVLVRFGNKNSSFSRALHSHNNMRSALTSADALTSNGKSGRSFQLSQQGATGAQI
eukprot:scaffold17366_cov182-Amphora_coffeaeformis.AAC.4